MTQIHYDDEISTQPLQGRRIRVIGYGIQGRAQALNLHDSGFDVAVGLRPGSASKNAAAADGLPTLSIEDAAAEADVLMLLIPDEEQAAVYDAQIAPNLATNAQLVFAHGFNIRFDAIRPAAGVDVLLVAPKGPGAAVREAYLNGFGVPALLAIHQDASGSAKDTGLAIAKGLGAGRAGVIETTFAEEAETDLFGEQVDLCGGVASLISQSFEVLTEAGYQPEIAYFEVLHEMKMIIDLIQEGGIESMWNRVSNTAEYGGRSRGPRIIDAATKSRMGMALDEIRDGTFAREWMAEHAAGQPALKRARTAAEASQIEAVGRRVRELFQPKVLALT